MGYFYVVKQRRILNKVPFAPFISVAPLVFLLVLTNFRWDFWKFFFSLSSSDKFLDLQLITSNTECYLANPNLDVADLSCDIGGRVFNYPEFMLLVASRLRLVERMSFGVGIFFQLIMLLSLFMLISYYGRNSEVTRTKIFLLALFCVSPPLLFVLERGNTDSLVFVLTIAGLSVLNIFPLAGLLFIFLSFGLKLYPAASILCLILSRKFLLAVVATISIVTWISFSFQDLIRVWKVSPYYQWNSFGLRVLPFQVAEYLSFPLRGKAGLLISGIVGILLLSLSYSMIYLSYKKSDRYRGICTKDSVALFRNSGSSEFNITIGSVGVFLSSYFMGLSWDTKLIFLFPVIIASVLHGSYSLWFRALIFMVVWASSPIYKPLQSLGDLMCALLVSYLFFIFVLNFRKVRKSTVSSRFKSNP
jgi:hypothetical protein